MRRFSNQGFTLIQTPNNHIQSSISMTYLKSISYYFVSERIPMKELKKILYTYGEGLNLKREIKMSMNSSNKLLSNIGEMSGIASTSKKLNKYLGRRMMTSSITLIELR